MSSKKLKVATCQFPVCGDFARNARYIKRFMNEAASEDADLVHFSETALSGYGRDHHPDFPNINWNRLKAETDAITALARRLRLWVILGSSHYVGHKDKPTNCLYLITNKGEIADRYDKCMLTEKDARVYSPGNHWVTFTIKDIKCGLLICADSCFPEMYNPYRHMGVELLFHSFHNATFEGPNLLDEVIPKQIIIRANDNSMWLIANNSSTRHSAWPSFMVRPDGTVAERLKRHVPGIIYHTFPDKERDPWLKNNKLMKLHDDEIYSSGIASRHPRALDRTSGPWSMTTPE